MSPALVVAGAVVAFTVGALTATWSVRLAAEQVAIDARRRIAALESAELVVMSPHGALVRVAVVDLEEIEAMRGSYRDELTDELHTVDLRMVKRLPW